MHFLDVVWFRGSTWNLLEDTEQFDIEISQRKECHFITLFNVNSSHSGKYSCMAVNEKHEIWHEFMLNVKNSKYIFSQLLLKHISVKWYVNIQFEHFY